MPKRVNQERGIICKLCAGKHQTRIMPHGVDVRRSNIGKKMAAITSAFRRRLRSL